MDFENQHSDVYSMLFCEGIKSFKIFCLVAAKFFSQDVAFCPWLNQTWLETIEFVSQSSLVVDFFMRSLSMDKSSFDAVLLGSTHGLVYLSYSSL